MTPEAQATQRDERTRVVDEQKDLQRAHKKRQRARKVARNAIEISSVSGPAMRHIERINTDVLPRMADVVPMAIDWARMPAECNPARGGKLSGARSDRKMAQIGVIAAVLDSLYAKEEVATVVEFGAGSGNLVLALAHVFPHFKFIAVDMRRGSIQRLEERARAAGLPNVSVTLGMIEAYSGPQFDCAIGLHACGNATEYAMIQGTNHEAAIIMSPCCT